ncbi:hypothetical protein J2R98_000171 [Alkalibacillus filiformis]|uniref:Uncharacterized protein n=1 Tax=Alkalibacillus filiformis TaxID=200990 RepID=A0ABU0DPY4_9BACI|nr:hypothetical protein [Alkalibacillus filiformis]MDQ0350368.1 hypothetical protein [Alkalibacillus filiformis]
MSKQVGLFTIGLLIGLFMVNPILTMFGLPTSGEILTYIFG